jgi:hypothetical protein
MRKPHPRIRKPHGAMAHAFAIAIATAIAAALPSPAAAGGWQGHAVDDSLTLVPGPVQWQWRDALPSRHTAPLLQAELSVQVVLALGPWVGRPARIYMAMPSMPPSSLSARWTTGGTMLAGSLAGGQRHLVFQGIVPVPRMEDTLRMQLQADARDPVLPQQVRFDFQIEVASP